MKKAIAWLLALSVLGAGGFAVYRLVQARQNPESILEVLKSGTVTTGDLEVTVSASGNVAVAERTEVMIQLPGTVADVAVSVDDRVEAGDVLVSMATEDLERTVRQTEIALELAELGLEGASETADPEDIHVAELALASAGKALQVARLNSRIADVDANQIRVQAQRAREQAYINLRDDGNENTRTAYAEAEAEERAAGLNAQATVQGAQSQLQAAIVSYEQAERALADLIEGPDTDTIRQQEIQLDKARLTLAQVRRSLTDAEITAPHDGIVAAVNVHAGTYQNAGQSAVTVVDDGTTYVDVTIDEIDIGAVAVGQAAEVVLDAYPELAIGGLVESIAPASASVGGLVAYQVRIVLAAPAVGTEGAPRIAQGMTATVQIDTETIGDLLLVPSWALRVDQEVDEMYTYVVVDGVPERRVVESGRRNDEVTEILSGLSDGETVASVLEQRVPFNFFAMGGPPGGFSSCEATRR